MIVFPHAKINLGLHVISRQGIVRDTDDGVDGRSGQYQYSRKREDGGHIQDMDHTDNGGHKADTYNKACGGHREERDNKEDGYHTVETVLYPVGLYDALEVVPADDQKTRLTVSGLTIPSDGKPNLVLRALDLVVEELRRNKKALKGKEIPPVHIYLHKCIPAGGGLGGGSSDAAYMLMLLNERFSLRLSHQKLSAMASALGADCPFFMHNQPMHATGRGDCLQPISLPALKRFHLLIVIPPVHVDTATAYKQIRPKKPASSITAILQKPVATWQEHLVNDFEAVIFEKHAVLGAIKTALTTHGATYASMSGSGSAIYGLFPTPPPDDRFKKMFPGTQVINSHPPVS